MKLFLDLDGVLADFDKSARTIFGMSSKDFEDRYGSKEFWKQIRNEDEFFYNLPMMHDAMDLWNFSKPHDPTILTGCPFGNWAQPQKVRWVKEYLDTDKIITCLSKDKRNHASPGDVIVDDTVKHQHLWVEMGGIFIVHTDATSSIEELKSLGF